MKRFGNLWAQVTSFPNLYHAYRLARRSKGDRTEVARFDMDLETHLIELQRELRSGTYRHGEYRQRTIYERKPRLISAAPFRDRVLHHVLMNVVDPLIDPRFIHDTYACRRGKGVHRAVARYQQWAGKFNYVLKLDISKYFGSIDQAVLLEQINRYIKDPQVLWLFEEIISSYHLNDIGKGLPIGNLTSQFLANLYLDGFDHWLKEDQCTKAYLRYVDDLFILGNSKSELWDLLTKIEEELAALRLTIHPKKVSLVRATERVDVLGYIVTPDRRWLRNDNGYRFIRRFKNLAVQRRNGSIGFRELNAHIQSWIGHAQHGETLGLRRKIFSQQLV